MPRVQLCEACGTEIVDPREGVCPSCGCMLPLHTTPTPTQHDAAAPQDDAALQDDPVLHDGTAQPDDAPTPLRPPEAGPSEAGLPEAATTSMSEPAAPGQPVTSPEGEPQPGGAAVGASADEAAVIHPTASAGAAPAPPTDVPSAADQHSDDAGASDQPAALVPAVAAQQPVLQPQWHPDSLQAKPQKRLSRRVWLAIGGAAVVVIAAIVTIVLIVTAAVPQRIDGLALLRDLPERPVVGSWELSHPLAQEVPDGDELYLNGYTAGPSTALLVWSTDRPLDAAAVADAPGETVISLVNTANGHTLWDRRVTELSTEFDRFDAPVVVSPPDADAIVLSQGDLMVAVSRRDGRVVSSSSEHSSVEGIGFPDFAAPAAFVPGMDGDLLISSTQDGVGTVGRYRSTDLATPLWQVTGDAGQRATTAGDKLFFDGGVYSLEDGSAFAWDGDLSWYYQQIGGELVAIDYSGNDTTIRGVDANTGAERWKATSVLPVILDATGLLVVADQSGERVRRLDPRTGEVDWRSDLTSTWDGAYSVGDTIMLRGADGGYTGIGARDGEIRYEEGDADGSLVGFSERTLVLALDGRLVGIDATTGEQSWSIEGAGDAYGFAAWGGGVVATASVLAAGSSEPAVLGVSDADRD